MALWVGVGVPEIWITEKKCINQFPFIEMCHRLKVRDTYGTLCPGWRLWSITSPALPTKDCLRALPSPDCKSKQAEEQTNRHTHTHTEWGGQIHRLAVSLLAQESKQTYTSWSNINRCSKPVIKTILSSVSVDPEPDSTKNKLSISEAESTNINKPLSHYSKHWNSGNTRLPVNDHFHHVVYHRSWLSFCEFYPQPQVGSGLGNSSTWLGLEKHGVGYRRSFHNAENMFGRITSPMWMFFQSFLFDSNVVQLQRWSCRNIHFLYNPKNPSKNETLCQIHPLIHDKNAWQ